MKEQLPLEFEFHAQQTFDSFYAGPNFGVIESLARFADEEEEQLFYLWGEEGSGKSHLLNGFCHFADSMGVVARLLPISLLAELKPAVLEGFAGAGIVCVDDVQLLCGREDWELAFFDLFNQQRDQGLKMVVVGSIPPAMLDCLLPDLKTRLEWGVTLQLKPFDDEQRLEALIWQASANGIELTPDVGRFILSRLPRDPGSMNRLLTELDFSSMSAQRRITIPFLKETLDL